MRIRPESFGFTLLLGSLAAIPPLSIDMGLPAFAALERELGASAAGAGLTLSLFMAGFACSQLVLGPLSDRYGRRPVLLAGLTFYALAGGLCAAAPSITALILLRLAQGVFAASGTVMAFAMVRDVFSGPAARTRIAYVTMVLGVAPIVAPTLGGWALLLAGWRAIYAFLGFAGVALAVAVVLGLPETRKAAMPHGIGLFGGFARMLRHRPAIAFAASNAMSFGALFAFVSGSPLVLMGSLGASAATYGLLFAITSGGILLGGAVTAWRSRHHETVRPLVLAALVLSVLSAAALIAVIGAGAMSLASLMPLVVLNMFCRGVIQPNATHGALEPMGAMAGLASAVVGFLQMAVGATSSALVAVLYPLWGPQAMAAMMALFSLATALCWWIAEWPSAAPQPAQMHRH